MRAQIFRIQRGIDERWYVSHSSGLFKVHSFRTQVKAEEFAKRWAEAHQPSIVRVVIKGEIAKECNFGQETPGIHWHSQRL